MSLTKEQQLRELTRPFPPHLVNSTPQGEDYVAHHVVTQRLIQVLHSTPQVSLVQVLRGFVPAIIANPKGSSKRAREGREPLPDVVVGVVTKLTLTFADGSKESVEETGDCGDPHNWPHDGARLKDAMSDALKRCAMRFGCGLHLWSQKDFYLFDKFDAIEEQPEPKPEASSIAPQNGEQTEPINAPSASDKGATHSTALPTDTAPPSVSPEPYVDALRANKKLIDVIKGSTSICLRHEQKPVAKWADLNALPVEVLAEIAEHLGVTVEPQKEKLGV